MTMVAKLGIHRSGVVVPVAAATVLAALAIAAHSTEPVVVGVLYLAAATPVLCAWDVSVHRLPHRLVLPAYPVVLVALALDWIASGRAPFTALACGLAWFAFMFVLAAGGGMGMGDVMLAGALGLSAGMLGIQTALAAVFIAFLLGGLGAFAALLGARLRLRSGARVRGIRIPFGPFLLAGFWMSVLLPIQAPL